MVLLAVIGSMSSCDAAAVDLADVKMVEMNNVLAKLEAYSNHLVSNDLTFDEMKLAYDEYRAMDLDIRDSLRENQPLFHLMADFLLIPMEKYSRLVGENRPEFKHKLVARTQQYYKHFRPLYMGQRDANRDLIKAKKTDDLVDSFLALPDSGFKKLTKKLLEDAQKEYISYMRQFNQIALQMDIFAANNEREVELILNYMNRDTTKILKEKILPLIHLIPDDESRNSDRLEFLREIFLDSLLMYGYYINEGKLVQNEFIM